MTQQKIYPGAENCPAFGKVFVRTGEKRAPRKGEFFLSGAIPEVYDAPNDLRTPYHIMVEVTPTRDQH
jgi:hypothetical protein